MVHVHGVQVHVSGTVTVWSFRDCYFVSRAVNGVGQVAARAHLLRHIIIYIQALFVARSRT